MVRKVLRKIGLVGLFFTCVGLIFLDGKMIVPVLSGAGLVISIVAEIAEQEKLK